MVGYFAPLMTLGLRCVPYHAHPRPIDFPTPNELLSLDSERTRYSSVMNSARHDSSPSQRNANTDLCMHKPSSAIIGLISTGATQTITRV
ncbi:unnamed protein product, partial [Haemonchus placei]